MSIIELAQTYVSLPLNVILMVALIVVWRAYQDAVQQAINAYRETQQVLERFNASVGRN